MEEDVSASQQDLFTEGREEDWEVFLFTLIFIFGENMCTKYIFRGLETLLFFQV